MIVFVAYIIEFVGATAGCNFFSDVSRNMPCTISTDNVLSGAAAERVFDRPIFLCTIYHIIQWMRCTVLLCAICMGSKNALWLWYVTLPVITVYGFAAFGFAVNAVFESVEG